MYLTSNKENIMAEDIRIAIKKLQETALKAGHLVIVTHKPDNYEELYEDGKVVTSHIYSLNYITDWDSRKHNRVYLYEGITFGYHYIGEVKPVGVSAKPSHRTGFDREQELVELLEAGVMQKVTTATAEEVERPENHPTRYVGGAGYYWDTVYALTDLITPDTLHNTVCCMRFAKSVIVDNLEQLRIVCEVAPTVVIGTEILLKSPLGFTKVTYRYAPSVVILHTPDGAIETTMSFGTYDEVMLYLYGKDTNWYLTVEPTPPPQAYADGTFYKVLGVCEKAPKQIVTGLPAPSQCIEAHSLERGVVRLLKDMRKRYALHTTSTYNIKIYDDVVQVAVTYNPDNDYILDSL